jgi:energy-converting hydrogenase Eha subunit C
MKPETLASIYEPSNLFVNLQVAADFLDIAASTAYDAAHTGTLCDGVPVIKIGRRYLVATSHLRRLAGDITSQQKEGN